MAFIIWYGTRWLERKNVVEIEVRHMFSYSLYQNEMKKTRKRSFTKRSSFKRCIWMASFAHVNRVWTTTGTRVMYKMDNHTCMMQIRTNTWYPFIEQFTHFQSHVQCTGIDYGPSARTQHHLIKLVERKAKRNSHGVQKYKCTRKTVFVAPQTVWPYYVLWACSPS